MMVNTFMRHLFRWRDHAQISLQPFILDRNDSGSSVYFCPCWSFSPRTLPNINSFPLKSLDGGAIEKSVWLKRLKPRSFKASPRYGSR